MSDLDSTVLRPVSKQSLRQDLTQRLILAIFRRELNGAQRLVEEELAARFAVSRTPVREAINQLATLGMVEMRTGRGAVLLHFGPDQLRDLYQVRGILEKEATRLACGKIERTSLAEMRNQFRSLLGRSRRDAAWSYQTIAADKELHDQIAASCGNLRLAHEISRYRQLVQAVREAIDRDSTAQARAIKEHIEILDGLLADNANTAAASMFRHIEGAANAAIEGMFEAADVHPARTSNAPHKASG